MTNTLAHVAAWEIAQIGTVGLPQTWTPNDWSVDNPNDNDCALFQSYAIYGDFRHYNVSGFANTLPHVDGAPGTLACYRWPGSTDDYDHIGLVTSQPDHNGWFYSLEANTSGDSSEHQVAQKARNVGDVVCFVAPDYARPTPPAPPAPPAPPSPFYKRKRKRMPFAFISSNGEISIVYSDGPNAGKKRPLRFGEWAGYAAQGYTPAAVNAADYQAVPNV